MKIDEKKPSESTPKPIRDRQNPSSLRSRTYVEHEILDGAKKAAGRVRVKANRILWCPKYGRTWYGIPMGEFAKFMEKQGHMQSR